MHVHGASALHLVYNTPPLLFLKPHTEPAQSSAFGPSPLVKWR
jgi:hypothetical protein